MLILEAMKMEHRITAPRDGTIGELCVAVGDQVENGQLLVDAARPVIALTIFPSNQRAAISGTVCNRQYGERPGATGRERE